ncbi:hypothetical protein N9L68_03915 [bacterium]|nr:hypothetical protein [bacterium]
MLFEQPLYLSYHYYAIRSHSWTSCFLKTCSRRCRNIWLHGLDHLLEFVEGEAFHYRDMDMVFFLPLINHILGLFVSCLLQPLEQDRVHGMVAGPLLEVEIHPRSCGSLLCSEDVTP